MIRNNGDRYQKNPYFLHSVCTTTSGPTKALTEMGSVSGYQTYYKENKTISEYGGLSRKKSKKLAGSRASEGPYEGIVNPPKIKGKRVRPFSAPRHQSLRSAGLKNKVGSQSNLHGGNS